VTGIAPGAINADSAVQRQHVRVRGDGAWMRLFTVCTRSFG
jgi:hypothetical protein